METFLQQVIDADTSLLLLLNGCHNEATDLLMWAVSSRLSWLLPACALIAISVRHGWRQALLVIATLATAVLIADQLSSGLIKHTVCRPRPSHNTDLMSTIHILNDYRGGMYGFTSSHAANSVAVAVALGSVMKNRALLVVMLLWALLQSYSRIYLGVHYPGDILGGIIVGTLAGWAAWAIFSWLKRRFFADVTLEFTKRHAQWMMLGLGFNLLVIMLTAAAVTLS